MYIYTGLFGVRTRVFSTRIRCVSSVVTPVLLSCTHTLACCLIWAQCCCPARARLLVVSFQGTVLLPCTGLLVVSALDTVFLAFWSCCAGFLILLKPTCTLHTRCAPDAGHYLSDADCHLPLLVTVRLTVADNRPVNVRSCISCNSRSSGRSGNSNKGRPQQEHQESEHAEGRVKSTLAASGDSTAAAKATRTWQ